MNYESPGKYPYRRRKQEILDLIGSRTGDFLFLEGVLDVPQLMALADVVVVPLTTADGATGHPVTLLEGMVAGRLVIASDLPGNSEVIDDGKNGFLFPNRNVRSLAALFRMIGRR